MATIVEHGHDISGTPVTRPTATNVEPGQRFYDIRSRQYFVSDGTNWIGQGAEGFSDRVILDWRAGQRGKPGLNADVLSTTEAVREIADPDFEILGTNATSSLCTYNAEGGLTLTTAGADGDGEFLVPHLDANQSPWTQFTWGTDKETAWSCSFETGADITNIIVWAGLKLTNTDVVVTDADQVFVRFEDDVAAGIFQVISSIGGTDTTTASTITVAVSTTYKIVISIDSARLARVYINGALIYTTTALTTAVDFIPYICVEADGAAEAKALTIYGQSISRDVG